MSVFLCYTSCYYFDCTYAGIGKEVGEQWNSRFMTFIPFLCDLSVELAAALTNLCTLESSEELLFQQLKQDLEQVHQLQLHCYILSLLTDVTRF